MNSLYLAVLANERPLINVDGTLLIDMALWLLLFAVLRPLLWKPMLRLIDAREAGMEGMRDRARQLGSEAGAQKAEYEESFKRARAAAQAERERLRTDAKRKEADVLGEARRTTGITLEQQRASMRQQKTTLQAEVMAMIPRLAAEMASKVLGREVRS